ncbi:choice-of-anchor Q domain-containing protein [Agromyces sp. NPDC055520]
MRIDATGPEVIMRFTSLPFRAGVVAVGIAGLAGALLAATGAPSPARADSVIVVDSTSQALGDTGCTLPEAILAANNDASVVPNPDLRSADIDTGCTAGSAAGSGTDVIELMPGATYAFGSIIDDAGNYLGPTATPLVTSSLVIEGRGATIAHSGSLNVRAFAVGPTGSLDLREVHVKDFAARGGNGGNRGGGGGLGAGGAIAVHDGALRVQWSTFEANGATGGNGGGRTDIGGAGGGGGGGLAGWGGSDAGGGGGSRGRGSDGISIGADGGGGGGTVSNGGGDTIFDTAAGGYRCGGEGALLSVLDEFLAHLDGDDAECAGGGGGGGGNGTFGSGDGGDGGDGGGGGGGAYDDGDGGHGGFGGGGGGATAEPGVTLCGAYCGGSGGDGGFGGGGGGAPGGVFSGGPGKGGTFAGNGSALYGGGGAGLGGAIFGYSATVIVSNSTFTRNFAVRGVAGTGGFADAGADNGSDAGGAIFTVGGALSVTNSTIAANETTGDGAGIVVYKPITGDPTSLALRNTIVAGNSGRDECFVLGGVAASGTDNLVTPHATDARIPCPAITQTADPELGALALNAPGRTPTMALAPTSPAIDTADAVVAPLDDQRGVARPQLGGVDIGAFEFDPPADTAAPTAAAAASPTANAAGWNTSDVTIAWNWTDTGGSGIDPSACMTSSSSSGEGAALLLSATCTDLAGNRGSAQSTVSVDETAPVVTCDARPSYVVGGTPTSGLSATVSDELSGPAATPVTATVTAGDIAVAGVGAKPLTGADVAGNTTTVDCEFVVAYGFSGLLQPVPQSSYKRGSNIPVRFQLRDASGQPISDTAAASLLSPSCLVFVTMDGQVKGCATYNPVSNTFQFDVKTTKALAVGTHSVGILVKSSDGDILNTNATTVRLR